MEHSREIEIAAKSSDDVGIPRSKHVPGSPYSRT